MTRLVHAGLAGLDPDTLAPVPLVAEGWSFSSDNTLEVTLRSGLRFHSGRSLEPVDVCATLAAFRDPALGSPHRAVVRAIGRCDVTGERTLRLSLSEPRATLLTDLEVPILRRDEARSPPRPEGDLDGLGPYRIERVAAGEVALAPARTGVLPEPHHGVIVRTVRDENARAQRLLAGQSDIAPNAISPALIPALEKRGLSVVARPGANVTYLLLHNERPPLDSEKTRRAVARAIDTRLIVTTLLSGRAQPAEGLMPPGHWAAPAPANEPVAGEPLELRRVEDRRPMTILSSPDRARLTLARVVAQMLNDAGLDVTVVPLDLGVMLARLDSGDYDMAILQMPELTEPNILRWFFHPGGVPGEGGEGKNRARYRDRLSGELLERAGTVRDRAERAALYRRLAERMTSTMPVVPLWHEDQFAVVSGRAASFRPSAEGRWLAVTSLK